MFNTIKREIEYRRMKKDLKKNNTLELDFRALFEIDAEDLKKIVTPK